MTQTATRLHGAAARPSTPPQQIRTGLPTPPTSKQKSPRTPLLVHPQSPRRIEEKQRQVYVLHLEKWAADHDSSHYFHGNIAIAPSKTAQTFELGASVRCVLTDQAGFRRTVVIRLYGPQRQEKRYKLVVRCGAGWMSSREYLNKDFFARRRSRRSAEKHPLILRNHGKAAQSNSSLVVTPAGKDFVVIRPLFRFFPHLPLELQQNILSMAASLTGRYRPGGHYNLQVFPPSRYADDDAQTQLGISLANLFRISKTLNRWLVPWIFPTTNFHFGVTGFTNFLWTIGPTKRALIRHITFDFGRHSSIHCIRWLAPDPVYDLFEPGHISNPPALKFLWRVQIQDLARELHLSTLTLDITHVEAADVPIVTRILEGAFASLRSLKYLYDGQVVGAEHPRLRESNRVTSWRYMCREWYVRHHQPHCPIYMSYRRKVEGVYGLERAMDTNKIFFDGT